MCVWSYRNVWCWSNKFFLLAQVLHPAGSTSSVLNPFFPRLGRTSKHAVKVNASIEHQMARTFWLKKKNGLSFLKKASNGVFFGGLYMFVRQRRGDNGNKSEDVVPTVEQCFWLVWENLS